ncbi:MAG TPA: hypothetical protein VK557_01395 [Pyrinomonadaceae bacterium]|nr:hypothetical protein [Pyrinomonadaceae bacterium]
MLIAVDGTGPFLDKTYYKEMANSFVKQVRNECPEGLKYYFRGASLAGEECMATAYSAFGVIIRTYRDMKKKGEESFKLFLTGYSRGGATVIYLARLLQTSLPDIEIECMALFDAVDRSSLSFVDIIPGNVKICYHAIRDPKVQSRWYFGNCGLKIDPPGKMDPPKTFFATHAGLGGMPWTGDHPTKEVQNSKFNVAEYFRKYPMAAKVGFPSEATIEVPLITEAQDKAGSAAVRSWMWNNMRKHGMVS